MSPGYLRRDNRAEVKQQINRSILLALSFSAATVVKSADQEEQIVWELRDQRAKQLLFDSPFCHSNFASISCWIQHYLPVKLSSPLVCLFE